LPQIKHSVTYGCQLFSTNRSIPMKEREKKDLKVNKEIESKNENCDILEEIEVEDLTVDGICGVY
jgi:mycofactocin precursor